MTAHVAIAAPQPLTIDLGGTRAPGDRQTLAVDALEIRYPEATWTLRRRARLSLAGGLALTGFELQADGQRVAIDLRADDRERTAHVVVSRLDSGGCRARWYRRRRVSAVSSTRASTCAPKRRRRAPARGRDGQAGGRPHSRSP